MVRRTISMSPDLEDRVRRLAEERGRSFSAVVGELLEQATGREPLPDEAAGDGPADLSTNVDAYLTCAVGRPTDEPAA